MATFELGLSAIFGERRVYRFALLLLLWAGFGVWLVKAADITVEGDCALAKAIDSANQRSRDRRLRGR